MRPVRIWATAFALVLSAGRVSGAASTPSLTESAGARLLESYLGAMAARDTVAAGRCWARESLARPGFWQTLHIAIGNMNDVAEFRKYLAESEAVVTGVRPDSNAWQLDFEWRPKAGTADSTSQSPLSMHYYVIRQDDRFVFINPVDLLPRTWLTHAERLCVFHFPPSLASADADDAMRFMDARCLEIARYLDADTTRKIDVYVPDSNIDLGVTVGELLLYPPSGGYCLPERRLVTSASFVNPHEVAHLFSMARGYPLVNQQVNEGVAVAFGGTHASTPDFCLVQTRNFMGDSLYVPLPELVAGDENAFFSDAEVTYLEAGGWARFLLDRYGFSKLAEWGRRCRTGTAVRVAFQEVYRSTLESLEQPWKRYVAEYDVPSVGTGIPAGAQLVSSWDDAAGDDNGDGSYRYPTNPGFRPGVLDLRRFEVLRDDRHAYFRLVFAEASRPVKDEATGHGYTPGAVIALKRSHPPSPELCHTLERISFGENDGFDLQINVGTGIMVYDPFGRSLVTSRAIRLPDGSGCGKSVEFSLPVSFLGSPSPNWKYFVGATVLDDEALTYLRSYPEPASDAGAPFTISTAKVSKPPPFIDLLLPPSQSQKALLGEVAPKGANRVVPMLGGSIGGPFGP